MPEFEFANLAVAIIVPFLSVWAAQRLVERAAHKRDATDAFLRVNRHVQEHAIAFMALRNTDEHGYQTRKNNAVSSNFYEVRHEQAERLAASVIELENDCFMLGLVFNKAADSLGTIVRELAHRAEMLLNNPPPRPATQQDCHQMLQGHSNEIAAEMKRLWAAQFGVSPRWARWLRSGKSE